MADKDFTPTKACTKCGEVKSHTAEFFNKRSAVACGLTAHCKTCSKNDREAYYQANKDKIKAASNDYYKANAEVAKARVLNLYHQDKEKGRARVKSYADANQEKIKAARVVAYKANKDAVKAQVLGYYKANKDHVQSVQAKWRERNKHRVREYSLNYLEKIKADPLLALKQRYRTFVSKVWRSNGFTKKSKAQEVLGCDWHDFKDHIERQFRDGMCWDRIGEMHLDHIVPLASAKDIEDLLVLNHYTNLRPLWAKDNLSKGSRMDCLI